MWPAAWWKRPLSTGSPSVHLLIGKERFLKKEFIEDLRGRSFADGADAGLNAQEFCAEEDDIAGIFDFLNTSPFAADHRMAVVWGVDAFDKDQKELFESAVGKLSASAVLVLESEQTNAKKDAFLKKISEQAKLVACHKPFDRDLPGWVQARAKKTGLTLDPRTVSFLTSCAGGELSTIVSNLEQLAAFIHPRVHVTLEDAEKLFQKRAEDDVFTLAQFLLDQKPAESLRVLDALFEEGARGPEIIAALAGQLERWKKGSARVAQGRTPEEIGLELKVPPFFQRAFFAQLKRLSGVRLQKLTQALLACDEQFKSGQTTERLALERFIWTS
jgi:DNA polymerase-3 subunit delta